MSNSITTFPVEAPPLLSLSEAESERQAAIDMLPDELIAQAKAELEQTDEFVACKHSSDEDAMIFDLALELQRLQRRMKDAEHLDVTYLR